MIIIKKLKRNKISIFIFMTIFIYILFDRYIGIDCSLVNNSLNMLIVSTVVILPLSITMILFSFIVLIKRKIYMSKIVFKIGLLGIVFWVLNIVVLLFLEGVVFSNIQCITLKQ